MSQEFKKLKDDPSSIDILLYTAVSDAPLLGGDSPSGNGSRTVVDLVCLVPQPTLSSSTFSLRCVSYGVLPPKKADKLFNIATERKKKLKMGGAILSSPAPKRKMFKIVKDKGVDPDMQSLEADGVGSTVLSCFLI